MNPSNLSLLKHPYHFQNPNSSEFDSANQAQLISGVSRKNLSNLELLNKLANTEALAEELKKSTPFAEIGFKELYLRSILPFPLKENNEKLVYDWFSSQLSDYEEQKTVLFDKALKLLPFKEAFALLVAAYRLPILLKNEEQKHLNPSKHFIQQCQLQEIAMGARLETLIEEHPSEYQTLDLTSLSPSARAMQFDTSGVSNQFFLELMNQQKLSQNLKNGKTWIKVAGLGSFLGAGILLGTVYTIRKWKETVAIPPLPTYLDHVKNYSPIVVISVALAILAAYAKHVKKKDPSLPDLIKSITPEFIAHRLKDGTIKQEYYYEFGELHSRKMSSGPYTHSGFRDFNIESLLKQSAIDDFSIAKEPATLIIPKKSLIGLPENPSLTITVLSTEGIDYLLIEISCDSTRHLFVPLNLLNIKIDKLEHALKSIKITDDSLQIPLESSQEPSHLIKNKKKVPIDKSF